jgi:hypothetical protein
VRPTQSQPQRTAPTNSSLPQSSTNVSIG